MMKQFIILLVVFFNCSYLPAQWKPAGERIKTEWATKIDVENVLPEYPRPIMERPNWVNLNGLWNYAITSVGQAVCLMTAPSGARLPFRMAMLPSVPMGSEAGRMMSARVSLMPQRAFASSSSCWQCS